MHFRSALSSLFLVGGVLSFLLAAINVWGSRNKVPLDKITSTPNSTVNWQHLTAQPLVTDSTPDFQSADVLSLAILPPNYSCGNCAERVASFVNAFNNHPARWPLDGDRSDHRGIESPDGDPFRTGLPPRYAGISFIHRSSWSCK